jgi:hypothetical protein
MANDESDLPAHAAQADIDHPEADHHHNHGAVKDEVRPSTNAEGLGDPGSDAWPENGNTNGETDPDPDQSLAARGPALDEGRNAAKQHEADNGEKSLLK